MDYLAWCRGEEYPVEVKENSFDSYRVVVGSEEHQIEVREAGDYNRWSLVLEGLTYEVAVEPAGDDSFAIGISGEVFEVRVSGRPRKILASRRHGPGSREDIRSPLAGNVWRILKQAGDPVRAGEVLMILEAMKMESEIKSPIDGIVSTMFAAEGTSIPAGTPLCVVEAASDQ